MKLIYTSIFAFLMTFNTTFGQTNLEEAVDFDVTTVHGEDINLFELLDAGKHVVLDFFFTTCPPCIESVPTVNDVYERFGCNKGDVYFLSIDNGDSDAQVLQYEEDYEGLLPSASGQQGGGNAVAATYNIPAYPTIILIAPDRSIVSQDIFPVNNENFDAALITAAGLANNPDACAVSGIHDLANIGTSIQNVMPNPTTSIATLDIAMEKAGEVRVEIYNMMGQNVGQVAAQHFLAGSYTIDLPMTDLANGTYSINLIQDDVKVDVTKLTVLR